MITQWTPLWTSRRAYQVPILATKRQCHAPDRPRQQQEDQTRCRTLLLAIRSRVWSIKTSASEPFVPSQSAAIGQGT